MGRGLFFEVLLELLLRVVVLVELLGVRFLLPEVTVFFGVVEPSAAALGLGGLLTPF